MQIPSLQRYFLTKFSFLWR